MDPLTWVRVCVFAVEIAGVGVELDMSSRLDGGRSVASVLSEIWNLDRLVSSIRVRSSSNRPFLEVYASSGDIVNVVFWLM